MSEGLRRLIYQSVALGALACGVAVIARNTRENLEELGVQSSTSFLWERAGFEINQKLVAFDADATVASALGVACLNTVLLFFLAAAFATAIGACVGIVRTSKSWPARGLAVAFVETFRNAPLLLQVFFWYFLVLHSLPDVAQSSFALPGSAQLNNRGLFLPAPQLAGGGLVWAIALAALAGGVALARRISHRIQDRTGRHWPWPLLWAGGVLIAFAVCALAPPFQLRWETPVPDRFGFTGGYVLRPEFLALVIALSLYNATYIAEIVRSALAAIPAAQGEAGQALGLSRWQTLRLVLLPQALRIISPPLATVYQNVLKSSALGAAIAYPELTSVLIGTVNNLVGQPVVIMAIVLTLYLGFSICIAAVLHWFEWRSSRWR